MDSSKIGYWLQVGANVGILTGLVLVGLQISQHSELARLEFYASEEDGNITMNGMQAGETLAEAWAKAIDDPQALTTSEMIQLDGYLRGVMTQFGRRGYLHQEGIYGTPAEQFIEWYADDFFGNPFAQAWWNEVRGEYSSNIRDAMDQAIEKFDDTRDAEKFGSIRKDIEARS